jgi:hypothetical protein
MVGLAQALRRAVVGVRRQPQRAVSACLGQPELGRVRLVQQRLGGVHQRRGPRAHGGGGALPTHQCFQLRRPHRLRIRVCERITDPQTPRDRTRNPSISLAVAAAHAFRPERGVVMMR